MTAPGTTTTNPTASPYRLAGVMNVAMKYTHDQLSLMTLRTFLEVAHSEGSSVSELSESMGVPLSTTSRQLLDLGLRNRKKEEGHGLVESRITMGDLRRKEYYLTDRGRKLLEQLADALTRKGK